MSRSKRLPVIKDRPRNQKKSTLYWRHIRSTTSQVVRGIKNQVGDLDGIDEDNSDLNNIPNPKSIVNDYDYCDYIFDLRRDILDEGQQKYARK